MEATSQEQPGDKLSTTDYRVYNRMAEHMEYFVFSMPNQALSVI